MKLRSRREQATALVTTLLVLLVLTIMGTATVFVAGQGTEVSASARAGDQAMFVADAGVVFGKRIAASAALPYTTQIPIKDAGGANVRVNTTTGPVDATATVNVALAPDNNGKTSISFDVGFSMAAGKQVCAPRLRIGSIGTGPGGSRREIEAYVAGTVQTGGCGGAQQHVTDYAGSGSY